MFRCRTKKKKKQPYYTVPCLQGGRKGNTSLIHSIYKFIPKKKKINDDHIIVAAKNRKPDVLTIGKMPKT